MQLLTDPFSRQFRYLRLSITDVCNFRCSYCLPNGYQKQGKTAFLSVDEIRRVGRAFTQLGVNKIRLTGGEPTLRRDFCDIISALRENDRLKTLAVTTNGYRVAENIAQWKNAGLTAINVSVDSLDPRQFQAITGQDRFFHVMKGIDTAFEAGFERVKVNTVLMKSLTKNTLKIFLNWIQHRSIQLRFIELMQTAEGHDFFTKNHLSGQWIRDYLDQKGWKTRKSALNAGPAQVFFHPDYRGEIGLILPYEPGFCQTCNRLRVSAKGQLHLCLFGEQGIELRDLLTEDHQLMELMCRIQAAVKTKKETHFLHQGLSGSTSNFSLIGG